ncbi:uncharacterized protein [Nicotiana sylvestris]|uniref:uncharacterized protein n=1 Tax=Nicotiana sylvestris TaxID=4096 RepID=UPI00388CCDBF
MAKTFKTIPQKEKASRMTKGLGEAVLMREPPPGEADIPKPTKEKKKKKSSDGSPKPKKAKVQKPEADLVASTREVAGSLCAEGEESDDCLLALKLSNQALSKSQAELARCEDEFKKLVSELDELKALHAQKEGELGDIRAHLERISRERADLDEQKKDDLIREELRVRDTENLGLKQCIDEVSCDKETLREKLTSVECQLQGARGEILKYKAIYAELVAELSAAKSEAAVLMSSYRKDVAATNARARKVSKEAELKLSRALEHTRLRSRKQALEDVYVGGIDLSAEIERTKALEEESAALLSSDDGSSSELTSGSEDDEDDGKVPEGEGAWMFRGSRTRPLKA